MRAAFHLHLFYPDIAIEVIDRVARLGRADIDVFATHVGPLDEAVSAALDRLSGPVERIEVPNVGWDIGPLFAILPQLRARGVELVAKLHTKKGRSGYAAEWRALAYEGTVADPDQVEAILAAFAAEPDLHLLGPRALAKSAAAHQFRNGALLGDLAARLVAPGFPPADWSFFAGTFFWARRDLLEAVAALVPADAPADALAGAARDGEVPHALERLFGLAAHRTGLIGLADPEGIEVARLPIAPDRRPILRTLVDRAERGIDAVDPDLAALIRAENPLAHYARHGRDADALDPSPYFSSDWYLRVNPDVAAAGMHPLAHYLHHGAAELRSTSPLFDAAYYRATYPDVTGDPLLHFTSVGLAEGRSGIAGAETEAVGDEVRRHYRDFDLAREARFLASLADTPTVAAPTVSVIMPAYNRAATVAAAIRSVLAQSHAALELIVVDDGSTDDTAAIVRGFDDPRVRLIEGAHAGVSAARNLGLAEARGDLIAYLDSDNRWVPWFLQAMTRHLAATDAEAGYAAIALRDDLGELTGYRGADFDWATCLDGNYVDLNTFVHSRGVLQQVGGFDTALRRMVDWDFILRVGRDRAVAYAPFVGCDYQDGRADRARVTVAEPAAFQTLVALKNRTGLAIGTPAFRDALSLSFAIKIAAPAGDRETWGDWHFAQGLAAAIERLGHRARVDCREEWGGHALEDEHVAIVLRGLLRYDPRPGQIGLLWCISHPDQPGPDEMERFARVYTASASHAALLRSYLTVPVSTLLQATDPERFRREPSAAPPVLFVGNSRGQDREIVRWAIEAGRPPVIYGGGWEGRVPREVIAADSVDNAALGGLYAGAGVVLNDHWPSMRAFGIVSNRLFDVAAAGGRAVSDAVPGIAALFGDGVREVSGPMALRHAIDSFPEGPPEARRARAAAIAAGHSFDARARVLVDDALALLGLAAASVPEPADDRLRVHAIVPHAPHGPQSSAYIRLVAPLTAPGIAEQVTLTLGHAGKAVPPCDVCIVQRTALGTVGEVNALIRTLAATGAALVVDVDDAFRLIGGEHPEAAHYRPLNHALERAMGAAAEAWFSTAPLRDLYRDIAGPSAIVPNALDPRLWRDWRAPPRRILDGERVRMLYMGTHTHAADFAHIRPALDALAAERPGAFDVTLIGITADVPPAPWLARLSPPADAVSYPRFVRWLRGQGPFDIGLAPLAPTPFNAGKSDVKLLDYAALGLLPVVEDCAAYRADPAAARIAVHAGDWLATLRAVLDDREAVRARAAAAWDHLWQARNAAAAGARLLARLRRLARER